MTCPSCNQRKARRACPALATTICPVCCGTKRLTEIQCPPDCGYLASAREHPAAVVKRQQEHDVALLLPTMRGLTEREYQVFFLLHTLIARHKPDGFARLVDEDVADAAEACAATIETSARGVIYEHTPQSLPAQRLATEMKTLVAQMREQGAKVYDHEIAVALRAIEKGGRETRKAGGGDTAYLLLVGRLLQQTPAPEPRPAEASGAGSLILP